MLGYTLNLNFTSKWIKPVATADCNGVTINIDDGDVVAEMAFTYEQWEKLVKDVKHDLGEEE